MTQDQNAEVTEYDVARRIAENQLKIKELTEQNTQLKEFFRQNDRGQYPLEKDGQPTLIVKVTSNSRIDDKLARDFLRDGVYDEVSKQTIDPVIARRKLSPSDIAKITKEYDNKIEIVVGD